MTLLCFYVPTRLSKKSSTILGEKRRHLCKTSLLIWRKTVLKTCVQKNVLNTARGIIINVTTEQSSKNDVNFGYTHMTYIYMWILYRLKLISRDFCVQQITQAVQGQQRKSHCFFFTKVIVTVIFALLVGVLYFRINERELNPFNALNDK